MMQSKAHGSAVSCRVCGIMKNVKILFFSEIHIGSYKKLDVEIRLSESLQPLIVETVSIVAGNSSEDFINMTRQMTGTNDEQESKLSQTIEKHEERRHIGHTSYFGGEENDIVLENLTKENNDDKLKSEMTKMQKVVERIEQEVRNRIVGISDSSKHEATIENLNVDHKGQELQAVMTKLVEIVGRIEHGAWIR